MRFLIAFTGLMSLLGCVSQAKYDNTRQQLEAANRAIAERRLRIAALEATIAAEQSELKRREAEMNGARRELASLSEAHGQSRAEVTQLSEQQDRLNDQLAGLLRDRTRLRQSTDELSRALSELARRKAEAERRVAEFKSLVVKFRDLIDAGTLRVSIADGRMVLQLPMDVLFDSGSAKLSKVGKDAITQVGLVLKDMPERRIQVEGHTDDVPIHTATYPSNWELASARAVGVIRALTTAGLDAMRLSAASYAEYHPLANNELDAGRALNRRIEIVIVPDLSMLPGFQELQQIVETS